jgi:hypothetical protein
MPAGLAEPGPTPPAARLGPANSEKKPGKANAAQWPALNTITLSMQKPMVHRHGLFAFLARAGDCRADCWPMKGRLICLPADDQNDSQSSSAP